MNPLFRPGSCLGCASILSLALIVPALGQAPAPGTLLVVSKQAHALDLIDPQTLSVIASVPVGDDPHEVIASSDGSRAYISNYGFGALHSLAVIDLVAHKPLPSIDLGALNGPHGLIFVGGETWFTAEGAKVLGRYNPATEKVDLVLGTGQNRTHMIYVSPDAEQIITTNVSSATVSIFEKEALKMPGPPLGAGTRDQPPQGQPPGPPMARTDWNQTVIPVGNGSEGFDVSPDGREIWVANAQDGTISVIDFRARKVVQTLAADVPRANRLKFTRDGTRVLVSSGPEVVVLDAGTRKVVKRVPVGHGSAGILMDPAGGRAFVSCGPDNYVAVIDLTTLAVTAHIATGGEPDGLAWATGR
jgi:YVTN family beta-propeller protein